MSGNRRGSANDAVRRTWDKGLFERKVEERKRAEQEAELELERGKKAVSANPDDPFAPTRAWLEERSSGPNLEARLGKVEIVGQSAKPGFWCAVCQHLSKDSNAYLDHTNSRFHQKNLGMSMRVKRATHEEVKEKLEAMKNKARGEKNGTRTSRSEIDRAPKRQRHGGTSEVARREEEPVDAEDEESAAAAAMGLPVTFGTTKK